jgi:Mg-chelatase subunit ChlD
LPAYIEEVRKEDTRSKSFQLSEVLINDPGNWTEISEVPVDVMLVIDVSGSMLWKDDNGDFKIDSAKEAAKTFVDQLNDTDGQDRSGIVIFNQSDYLYQLLTSDKIIVKNRIDTISVNSHADTQIEGGIRNATEHLNKEGRGNANKVQILLSDGRDDPCCSNAEDAAQEAAINDITIYTIGLGSTSYFNEPLLREIADITGGEYYHAPTGADLEGIYKSIAHVMKLKVKRIGLSDEKLNKPNIITMTKVRQLEDICSSFGGVQEKLAFEGAFSIHIFNISQTSGKRNVIIECVSPDFPKASINATVKRIVALNNTETGELELAEIIVQM